MAISYSSIAKPTASTPSIISIASPAESSTKNAQTPSSSTSSSKGINHLILDAGPLLSLAPLRHLAQTFHTTPMVLAELRDPKAREHWEMLKLSGVDVRVENPSAEAMAKVTAFARKTGDIAVLSQTDLSVIGLTYMWEVAENGEKNVRHEPAPKNYGQAGPSGSTAQSQVEDVDGEKPNVESEPAGAEEDEDVDDEEEEEALEVEEITRSIDQVLLEKPAEAAPVSTDEALVSNSAALHDGDSATIALDTANTDVQQEEEEESDGGEWITPSNVSKHRSHDLGLLPNDTGTMDQGPIAAACMTGDFAVQNVLLGMGLGLVGEGGKRISKVKSFVLRCHACFKICKDNTKRFCPSCGNPSLLRTTVTVSAKTGQQRIHLKKNFQYHLRGTKFTIPDAKPGRAKGQQKGGTGLILREDQAEWQNAVKSQNIKKQKEERKVAKGALDGWNDPDWMPEIITVGMSGKGRHGGQGMPTIGHGRKNPNQARRKR